MDKAAFKLDSYHFTKASLNFDIPENVELGVSFSPSGIFHSNASKYELTFKVSVDYSVNGPKILTATCVAFFSFQEKISFNEIPDFFYPNSLAIIFPYIRAFVSTISLQANVQPIVLPTVNLSGMTNELKMNTKVIE